MRYNRGMVETTVPWAPKLWATLLQEAGAMRALTLLALFGLAVADACGAPSGRGG